MRRLLLSFLVLAGLLLLATTSSASNTTTTTTTTVEDVKKTTTTTSSSSSSNGGCIKTKNYSGKQCRDMKTRNQEETIGRVCVEMTTTTKSSDNDNDNDDKSQSSSLIMTVFEVTDPSYTLQSARVWIGTPEEMDDQGSTPTVITKLAPRGQQQHHQKQKQHEQQLERTEEEEEEERTTTTSNRLEIAYPSDYTTSFHHTCPSCKDQELLIMATARVVVNSDDDNDDEITIYGFEKDYTSFLSYILGDYWTVESSLVSTPTNEDKFDGFSIDLTCKCHQQTAARRLADRFLLRSGGGGEPRAARRL